MHGDKGASEALGLQNLIRKPLYVQLGDAGSLLSLLYLKLPIEGPLSAEDSAYTLGCFSLFPIKC